MRWKLEPRPRFVKILNTGGLTGRPTPTRGAPADHSPTFWATGGQRRPDPHPEVTIFRRPRLALRRSIDTKNPSLSARDSLLRESELNLRPTGYERDSGALAASGKPKHRLENPVLVRVADSTPSHPEAANRRLFAASSLLGPNGARPEPAERMLSVKEVAARLRVSRGDGVQAD